MNDEDDVMSITSLVANKVFLFALSLLNAGVSALNTLLRTVLADARWCDCCEQPVIRSYSSI